MWVGVFFLNTVYIAVRCQKNWGILCVNKALHYLTAHQYQYCEVAQELVHSVRGVFVYA